MTFLRAVITMCRLLIALSLIAPSHADTTAPLPFHGWTLTHDDMAYNLSAISRMQEFGVTHVQLSHRIVTRVDQFQSEPEVVDRVRTLASAIHSQGGQAIVWMQELNTSDTLAYCFDLDGEQMQEKMQAYRDALTAAPEIDGVMISFGSAPSELQYVLPSCKPLEFAQPKARYKAIIEAVSRVVMDEFGKQVYVRTFYHKGHEIPILRNALQETKRPIVVMSKAEPNDFEPYYPLNPLIADVGDHDQFFELDCAGEYWGRGALPFVAIEYFVQRYREAAQRQATGKGRFIGSTCRVDRYEYSALETLNEANLFAQAQLVRDPSVSAQTILRRFVESQYDLPVGSDEHHVLADILRRTYWIGRKMYYAKGEWAFKKGSDLPSSNTDALGNMIDKSISQWEPAYTPITAVLLSPGRQTLQELGQEKFEASDLARRNLEALEQLRSALQPSDYTAIETLLLKQRIAADIWRHMSGAVFAARSLNLASSNWAAWHLEQMEAIAEQLDQQSYPQLADNTYPFSSDDIRAFVENERRFLLATAASPLEQLTISMIDIVPGTSNSLTLRWLAEADTQYRIELSQQLPNYTTEIAIDGTTEALPSLNDFTITDLDADSPYWLRITASRGEETVSSGDFPVWTLSALDAQDSGTPSLQSRSASGGGALSLWCLIGLAMMQWARRRGP